MAKSKSEIQQAYMRKNYVRFPLDLRPEVLEAFRAACEKNRTKPTTEIKKFIARYCAQNDNDNVEIEVKVPKNLLELAKQKNINVSACLSDVLITELEKKEEL